MSAQVLVPGEGPGCALVVVFETASGKFALICVALFRYHGRLTIPLLPHKLMQLAGERRISPAEEISLSREPEAISQPPSKLSFRCFELIWSDPLYLQLSKVLLSFLLSLE